MYIYIAVFVYLSLHGNDSHSHCKIYTQPKEKSEIIYMVAEANLKKINEPWTVQAWAKIFEGR